METLQAILLALVGAFVGIFLYLTARKSAPVQKEIVQIVEEPRVLPYWTAYSPGYDYWPRYIDSYWLNYVPFYGPITGGSYKPWGPGGHHSYRPHYWDGRSTGHSGVSVGGGGGGKGSGGSGSGSGSGSGGGVGGGGGGGGR
jgi:hypothetical protein